MTVTEFLAWNPQDSDRCELIDGTPQAMAPAAPRHGAIQNEVGRLIGNRLAELRPACRVITETGIQPKVRADLLRREEDGTWPDNPLPLTLGDAVTLESIDFTMGRWAGSSTSGRSPPSSKPWPGVRA
jgi:Uma2 family endonuclease